MIAHAISRAMAAAGLSALFFQDLFGIVAFDDRFQQLTGARPRIGRSHLLYCLDLYKKAVLEQADASGHDIILAIESQVRKASLVPVVSDFLFPDAKRVIGELAHLNAVHDVFLLMADVRFAYEMPALSDGWIDVFDVESGRSRVLSRRELRRLGERVNEWQDDVARLARDAGLDLVRVGLDRWEMENTLVEFTAERRLRKM